jgi:hypothetical protein
MVSSNNCMEPILETPFSSTDALLAAAAYHARDAQAQCVDVSAMAFPTGHMAPSEEKLVAVATKMRALISGIENIVSGQNLNDLRDEPKTWRLLSQSGFLREPGLIDFILARFAEDRLNARILAEGSTPIMEQLPAKLLSDGNPHVADAAQAILLSETSARRTPHWLYKQLSPELLYQLVWRVVAVLQLMSGVKNSDHMQAAKTLLAGHDEGQSGQGAARKLIHLLANQHREDVFDPENAGLPIFIAAMAARTGLDQDHILRLIDGHSSTPLATLLRACDVSKDDAMAVICLFKGFNLTPNEINIFDSHYTKLSLEDTFASIANWGQERLQYLTFAEQASDKA